MDLRSERIDNRWLLLTFAASLLWVYGDRGLRGLPGALLGAAVPVLLLFPVFFIRALGAGDIKLFAVLGVLMGWRDILRCIVWSFVIGAVFSMIRLVRCGIAADCFRRFSSWIRECGESGRIVHYRTRTDGPESVHFSVAIFSAALLWMAGGFTAIG